MRKEIFKFSLLSAFIVFGTLFSACVRQPPNTAQNSNAANAIEEKPAQPGKSAENSASISNAEISDPKTTAAPDKEQRKEAIDKYIAGVAKVSDATEYEEARKIVYGDLDGDGDEDAAAQFTLEGVGGGGNNYGFYLAVFRNEDGRFKGVTDDVIGGKLNRDVTFTKIENGKMLFDTKGYGKDDGACCPSIEGKTAYVLEGNKLIERKSK